jgi:hypothetical protein
MPNTFAARADLSTKSHQCSDLTTGATKRAIDFSRILYYTSSMTNCWHKFVKPSTFRENSLTLAATPTSVLEVGKHQEGQNFLRVQLAA